MAVRILAQCAPGECNVEPATAIPTGGIERGKLIHSGDRIVFAYARAVPADLAGVNDPNFDDSTIGIAEPNDLYTPVLACDDALITGANTGVTFNAGDDVFFVPGSETLATSKTSASFWIGHAKEPKGTNDTSFLIDFDGRNPSRSVS